MRKHWVSLIALLAFIALAWWAKSLYLGEKKADKANETPLNVQTVLARTERVPTWLETVAPLRAKQHIQLTSQVQGQVEKILQPAGAYVEQGTPVLKLRPDFVIKAPISGYLGDWKVTVGEFANVGTVVVELINKSNLTAIYSVPETYVTLLKPGQKIKLTLRAFKDQTFEGTVSYIAPEVSKDDHSIHVKADIPNPKHVLFPGMFAHIKHLLKEVNDAVVVPESAVVRKISGYEVFVISDHQAKRQEVEIGQRFAGRVHITKGIQKGQTVVISIPPTLYDGRAVKVTPWTEDW